MQCWELGESPGVFKLGPLAPWALGLDMGLWGVQTFRHSVPDLLAHDCV